ncbi:MAG: ASKHA domain-containing protein, partial [Candidatus Latescibacteria bacterium]|nr:ASKHA domain-containing protein [Candidatus Latescibacterota bacterium]
MTAAIAADVQLYNSCGGEGVCRECKVIVREGRVASELMERLTEEEREAGYRLACCTTVLDDVVIEVPPESRIEWEQILTDGTEAERGARAFGTVQEVSRGLELERRARTAPAPLVRKAFVRLSPPTIEDNISDLQRLYREVRRQHDTGEVGASLGTVRRLGRVLREGNWEVTVTLGEANSRTEILQIEPGDTTKRCFGVVVDVGTTTVVVSLVDLTTGEILDTKATHNRQIRYGQDVITRIIYAEKPDGLEALHKAVVDTINGLISSLVTGCGISLTDVVFCACGGNTTMTHLLLRIDPYFLRRAPYVPMASTIPVSRAVDAGIRINPRGWMACLPGVASFVGGDITAGVLAAGIDEAEKPSLLIDLGTNGEIALGNREWLVCSSASAGPAFEGSGVRCGVRSVRGAVQGVTIDPESLSTEIATIEDGAPVGLCGSGYIELLSELLFSGLIDRQGALQPERDRDRIREGPDGP